jgi:hypothetical protein
MAGVESTRVVKPVGEGWGFVNVSGHGWLFDIKGEEVVGEMEVLMRGDGSMEVVFPAMGEGRYGFIVDVRNDAGEVTRVLDGYVGYDGPEAVEEAVEDAEEETILVYMNGEQRRAVMAPTSAAHRYAAEAEKAMAAVGEIDKKLELAEKLEASFSGKMADFVVPNKETGTWWVGGVDSLLPWEGVDGVDGAKVKRIEIDSTDKLPESGETCNGGYYYYVTGRKNYAKLPAGGVIYVYVEDVSYEGLLINDFVLGNRYEASLDGWVDMIETAYLGQLEAEVVDEKHLMIKNVGMDEVTFQTYSNTYHDLYLQDWCGYRVYGWVVRLGVGRWVRVGNDNELGNIKEATFSDIGGVVLTNSLLGSNESYVLPTKEATRAYIDGEVSRCAKKSELTELVRKDELEAAGYLKPDDVVDYVTEAQVDSKIEENLSGVALQSSFVVLSETEYNLLPDTAEGVFYFTYAD